MSFTGTKSAILAELASLLLPDGLGNLQLDQSPPQFDNSLKVATTASVQRALGGFSGFTQVTTNSITLTAANAGQLIETTVLSTAIALPALSTMPVGSAISIFSTAPGAVISANGSDKINNGTTLVSSTAMAVGDTITLVSSGFAWYVQSGTANLINLGNFGASFAGSGYQKLPSGMIIQWGVGISMSGTSQVNNFPIAFPNGPIVFSGNDTGSGSHALGFAGISASQFESYGNIATTVFQYICLGH
jgi:hypothetical protein